MAYAHKIRRGVVHRDGDEIVREREVVEPVSADYSRSVLSQIIWFVAGVILVILAFRFTLSLLGANTTNAFANFIYNISHPFVAPFFGLFNYDNIRYGVSRFEVYTLVAMLVYAAVAWALTALVNIGRR